MFQRSSPKYNVYWAKGGIALKQLLLYCILTITFFLGTPTTLAALNDEALNVSPTKEWTITFNGVVDEATINEHSVYITDGAGEKIDVTYDISGDTIVVKRATAYEQGKTYTLIITEDVTNQEGLRLAQRIEKPFTIALPFVTVSAEGEVLASFATFAEAKAALPENGFITENDRVIHMTKGVVVTTSLTTLIYGHETMRKEYAGVTRHTELLYVDSTDKYVKVLHAGEHFYVKHSDVKLLPNENLKSYYVSGNSGLGHVLYNHVTNTSSSYIIGKAPSFLTKGKAYYSTDGHHFYDSEGTFIGESYNYFQYVSPRVASSYSAEEIDAFIMRELEAKEKSGTKRYEHATTKSALIGFGKTLKQVEQEKRVNALLLLSLAIHEGDYGMSCHALHYNNTFGFNVTDTNDACDPANVDTSNKKYYASIADNVHAVVDSLHERYLNPAHLQPNSTNIQYNGAAFGDKLVGMNVRYATDPYWGAKTAAHMYKIDQALGGKDYKAYDVGFTTKHDVTLYNENMASVYTYAYREDTKRFGIMPITLSKTPSTKDGYVRVVSELMNDSEDVYIESDHVRIVPTH